MNVFIPSVYYIFPLSHFSLSSWSNYWSPIINILVVWDICCYSSKLPLQNFKASEKQTFLFHNFIRIVNFSHTPSFSKHKIHKKPSVHYFPSNDSEPVDKLSFFLLALWIVATWKMVLGRSVCLGKPGRLCYNLIIFSLYHHLCCKGLTQQAWVTQTLYSKERLALDQLLGENFWMLGISCLIMSAQVQLRLCAMPDLLTAWFMVRTRFCLPEVLGHAASI